MRFANKDDIRRAQDYERFKILVPAYAQAVACRRNNTWRGRKVATQHCDFCGCPIIGRHMKRHDSSRAHGSCLEQARKLVSEIQSHS